MVEAQTPPPPSLPPPPSPTVATSALSKRFYKALIDPIHIFNTEIHPKRNIKTSFHHL